jgi:CDP-paratose 2-epimerase
MDNRYILITGGAGFIGTNLAYSYLKRNQPVHIFDNLSRPGVEQNIGDLLTRFPGKVLFTKADVRNRSAVAAAVESAGEIYHLAAQVAVTTSLEDPMADPETNLVGTLHLLEAIRNSSHRPPLLFTSTNKVYGALGNVALKTDGLRYEPVDRVLAQSGVSEQQSLEFLSPYGCSKGSADQYVLDYAKSYGLQATVFRMSCIYGPHQLGSEDQGWVAHFVRQALKGELITLFGDGKQVRDLLYVGDLVPAMQIALSNIAHCSGHAFNLGGGPENSVSLLEVISRIKNITGNSLHIERGPERLGDQRWYMANTSKAQRVLGWQPAVSVQKGLRNLINWYNSRPALIQQSDRQVA